MFIVSSLPTSNNLNRTNNQQLQSEVNSKHAMFLATITLRVFFVFLFIRPQIQSVKPGPLMWKRKAQQNWSYIEFPVFLQLSPPTFLQSRRNSSCNSSFTALPDRKSVVFPGVLVLTARKLWSCWWPLVSLSNMGQQDVMDSCQWIFGPYRDL